MPQALVYILLLFALVLPVLGAAALRVLASRMALPQLYAAAAAIFVVVLTSVLLLARGDVPSLQIGRLSVLLPVAAPEDTNINIPVQAGDLPTSAPPAATLAPAATSAPAGTSAPAATSIPTTAVLTELPTATATPTAPPTAAPTEAPTAEPTAAPIATVAPTAEPTAPPAPPQQRRYTVKSGDTLRSIAEKFNVSVAALLKANKLTAEQADSLRVGQELIIP